MVVSPTPSILELTTTNDKITCGNAAAKPFNRLSVECEGHTITGSVAGNSYFEMRCVDRCDLDCVVSGAEIYEFVSCGNMSIPIECYKQ